MTDEGGKKHTDLLIAFEGIDGAGKSTQAGLLHDYLLERGYNPLITKEPTDGPYGRRIKELALRGRDGIDAEEEYLLFLNDRKEHVEDVVIPAIMDNRAVILDRYYFSTIAYQGARGFDPEMIREQNESFAVKPDLVFILDIAPHKGLIRIKKGREKMDKHFSQLIDGKGGIESVFWSSFFLNLGIVLPE